MAMTINSSPVLVGESAVAFVQEAERNGKCPTPRPSVEREAELREAERRSQQLLSQLNRTNG